MSCRLRFEGCRCRSDQLAKGPCGESSKAEADLAATWACASGNGACLGGVSGCDQHFGLVAAQD
jgi:hypothetical protein